MPVVLHILTHTKNATRLTTARALDMRQRPNHTPSHARTLGQVMFRKVMREPPVGQVALTFSVIGVLNALLVWPVCLALYLSGTETMPCECGTWIILLVASIMLLGQCTAVKCARPHAIPSFVNLGNFWV